MNWYLVVIVVAIIAEYFLNVLSEFLNNRRLSDVAPLQLQSIYEENEYERSQRYTRDKSYFGIISTSLGLVVLGVFWLFGGFNWIHSVVTDWSSIFILQGIFYIGVFVLISTMFSIPFGLYSTFVIEKKYGFNNTTIATFALDSIKALLLSAALGIPLLAVVLLLFGADIRFDWVYCWVVLTIFSVVLQVIAPLWIMPLFNKFEPLENGDLREAIFSFASKVDFRISDIFVIDGSKRSNHSNAFFTGIGRTKRIALFDTLISKHSLEEIVAVVAHEIGHYKKGHIKKGLAIGVLHSGIILWVLSIFLERPGLYEAFKMGAVSDSSQLPIYAGLLFFGLLYKPMEMILSLFSQMISRHNEKAADKWACEYLDDATPLVGGLKKLAADNLSNLDPHPMYVLLNYSHPPLSDRIDGINAAINR